MIEIQSPIKGFHKSIKEMLKTSTENEQKNKNRVLAGSFMLTGSLPHIQTQNTKCEYTHGRAFNPTNN